MNRHIAALVVAATIVLATAATLLTGCAQPGLNYIRVVSRPDSCYAVAQLANGTEYRQLIPQRWCDSLAARGFDGAIEIDLSDTNTITRDR